MNKFGAIRTPVLALSALLSAALALLHRGAVEQAGPSCWRK